MQSALSSLKLSRASALTWRAPCRSGRVQRQRRRALSRSGTPACSRAIESSTGRSTTTGETPSLSISSLEQPRRTRNSPASRSAPSSRPLTSRLLLQPVRAVLSLSVVRVAHSTNLSASTSGHRPEPHQRRRLARRVPPRRRQPSHLVLQLAPTLSHPAHQAQGLVVPPSSARPPRPAVDGGPQRPASRGRCCDAERAARAGAAQRGRGFGCAA